MRIGVDIDGVMYQWERTARYMLRDVLPNSPYARGGPLGETQDCWEYIQNSVSPEHWNWLWTEGVRLGLFRHGHLHPGTIQAVRRLAELGDVVLITHRPKNAVNDTLAWISYQQLPVSGLHLLTNGEPKSSVKPHCDVYIDDKIENVVNLVMNVPRVKLVALMDRPWNQDADFFSGPARRVNGWQHFIDAVQEVA